MVSRTNVVPWLSHMNSQCPGNFWYLGPAFHAKSCLAHGWAGDSMHAASWEQCNAFWAALCMKRTLWRSDSLWREGAVAVVEELGPQWEADRRVLAGGNPFPRGLKTSLKGAPTAQDRLYKCPADKRSWSSALQQPLLTFNLWWHRLELLI